MHQKTTALTLIGFGIVGVGVFFMLTPAKHLLAFDRRTGYQFYRKVLERTGSEELAVAAAARFYRVFGFFIAAFGGLTLVVAGLPALEGP